MTGSEQVLEAIRLELVALLGDGLTIEAVRVDVDVFEGNEALITGRWLDSMDLVQVMATLEDRFGVNLAVILSGDEPMTLTNIARHIARSLP
jgi:acyl carrier protein